MSDDRIAALEAKVSWQGRVIHLLLQAYERDKVEGFDNHFAARSMWDQFNAALEVIMREAPE